MEIQNALHIICKGEVGGHKKVFFHWEYPNETQVICVLDPVYFSNPDRITMVKSLWSSIMDRRSVKHKIAETDSLARKTI